MQVQRGTKRRGSTRQSSLTDRDATWFRLACAERWWVPKSSSTPITHASLDGLLTGRLGVPEDRRSEFYAALASDVKNGRQFFLNELHTNSTGLIRLFFDLDLKGPTVRGDEFAIEFAQAAQQTARQFFPNLPASRDDRFDAVVVSRDPDTLSAPDGSSRFTEGYHVYFPNLWQHRKDVLTIFFQLLQSCKMRLHRNPLENPWEKVLDPEVYDRTGLRLYGSCTIKQCPDCQQRGGLDPDCACGGSYQVNGRHRYERIVAYLHGRDGTSDPEREASLKRNALAVLLTCSVQVPQNVTQPSPLGFVADPTSVNGLQSSLAQAASRTAPRVRTGWERVSSAGVLQVVLVLVRSFARQYENLTVTSVQREKHQTKYEVLVEGPGDRYCFNKIRSENGRQVAGDHHRSQKIYFEIFTNRVVQRCRCSCEPDPAAGVLRATTRCCSSSQVDIKCVYLSPEQTKSLFPNFQCEQMSFMYGLYQDDCSSAVRLQKLATFTRYSALKGWQYEACAPAAVSNVAVPRGTVFDY